MSSDWFNNDDLFLEKLRQGHEQAALVAETLAEYGLKVEVTPMQVRETIEDRGQFADEFDLTVGEQRPCSIDVKSRDLSFTGPDDFPYRTALVDTVSGWDQKEHKPLAIVLRSQPTGGLAVIRVSGATRWTKQRRFDRHRKIEDLFYEVASDELATFDEFVDWLKSRELATR